MSALMKRALSGATLGAILAFLQIAGATSGTFASWAGSHFVSNLVHMVVMVLAAAVAGSIVGLVYHALARR